MTFQSKYWVHACVHSVHTLLIWRSLSQTCFEDTISGYRTSEGLVAMGDGASMLRPPHEHHLSRSVFPPTAMWPAWGEIRGV